MNNPLVSISCITFNHAPYIRECLDGFLMQQCDFEFEILIHDDASTDGTQEIIKEYQEKYPDIIKPILQQENQYSKGVRGINLIFNFPRAKGKYIALCEGDDYWVDPKKLQKQVSFLETNLDYNFSMGRVDMFMQKSGQLRKRKEHIDVNDSESFTVADYLKHPFSQTSTFVFRNGVEFPDWIYETRAADQALVIIATGDGKIKYHPEILSIYRIHSGGVAQRSSSLEDTLKRVSGFFQNVDTHTQGKYTHILDNRLKKLKAEKQLIELKKKSPLMFYIKKAWVKIFG
jgi:glycosyltransferase involved in cell wall biosynthesis